MPNGTLPPVLSEAEFEDLHNSHMQYRAEIGSQQQDLIARREVFIVEDMKERSKLNYFAFAIVAGILGLAPNLAQEPIPAFGALLLLFNGMVGWIALWHQLKINQKHMEFLTEETQIRFREVLNAYGKVGSTRTRESAHSYRDALNTFASWRQNMPREERMAKLTPLNLGIGYFINLIIGISLLGGGYLGSFIEVWTSADYSILISAIALTFSIFALATKLNR